MPLRSPQFADSPRLQSAAANSPPLRPGERGDAVARAQAALVAVGFAMPVTTAGGPPDGIYGDETVRTVGRFQTREGLSRDGVAGRDTLTRLDELLLAAGPPAGPLPVTARDDFAVTTARKARPRTA